LSPTLKKIDTEKKRHDFNWNEKFKCIGLDVGY
jgi:hypothetical protein